MNIHYLQHVPFEGLGSMEAALIAGGHQLSSTHLYKNQRLPSLKNIDWLIVMGGPMGIHDEAEYPWLLPEKKFIQQAIESGKTVLGVCLGAQLIAAALGAKIYKNSHKEIGWFKINRNPQAETTILATAIPPQAEVFHWHGDTFDLPDDSLTIAESHDYLPLEINKVHFKNDLSKKEAYEELLKYKKKLIKTNEQFTLEGIGYECGFNSKTSFYTNFKKETGLTPKEFKNK